MISSVSRMTLRVWNFLGCTGDTMANHLKQLKLRYPAYDPAMTNIIERSLPKNIGYVIEQVIGDVNYKPGQFLSQQHVRELCRSSKWKIIMEKSK
jgi:hypothetical protein